MYADCDVWINFSDSRLQNRFDSLGFEDPSEAALVDQYGAESIRFLNEYQSLISTGKFDKMPSDEEIKSQFGDGSLRLYQDLRIRLTKEKPSEE